MVPPWMSLKTRAALSVGKDAVPRVQATSYQVWTFAFAMPDQRPGSRFASPNVYFSHAPSETTPSPSQTGHFAIGPPSSQSTPARHAGTGQGFGKSFFDSLTPEA